jgi:methylmalonyl-CoA mutase N-terminal domain/subunit
VNKFQSEEAESPKPFRVDSELERRQVARLRAVRAGRSETDVRAARGRLEQAAQGVENLLPRILECCRMHVTVGEISDTLRTVFGEYREGF